ncbi:MAG: pimeloyl-ACP methyl ester esterase BioH [Gammaproteobacteria bacterium]|nr:pimeloyl-ACP methyl ester esterase BioH [Gammaproteobacteria bacterium]
MLTKKVYGAGPDLVLLHGWSMNSAVWAPLLPLLQTRYRVHCVDLPGHGFNRHYLPGLTLRDWSQALREIIPENAQLLAWSLGGLVALDLCASGYSANRVDLIASTPCFVRRSDWPDAMREVALDNFATSLRTDYRKTMRDFLALQALGEEHIKILIQDLNTALTAGGEPSLEALTAGLHILRNSDVRAAWQNLQCPASCLLGEKDGIVPAKAALALQQLNAQANIYVVPRSGHAPFISHPQQCLDFWRSIWPSNIMGNVISEVKA